MACAPLRVEACAGLGYEASVAAPLQREAALALHSFAPLVQYGCSAQLQFFLCAVYLPLCTDKVPHPIGPCRGVCESVRERCNPVLHVFGFPWPDALRCDRFPPENNERSMCMQGPGEAPPDPQQPPCPRNYVLLNRTRRCVPACAQDGLWTASERHLAEVWTWVWASLCAASALGASLLGWRRRPPPHERPLLCLALCYLMLAVAFLARLATGRPCAPTDGLADASCALVFLLHYYFSIAIAVWWVLLSASWFLARSLAWSNERLQRHTSMLHVAGWGLPAAHTIAVLVLRDVQPDELTGACFVGHQSSHSQLVFVLVPQFLYLVVGMQLMGAGFFWQPHPIPPKLRILEARLGIFSGLYCVSGICVIASLAYEYWNRESWLAGRDSPVLWVFLLRGFMSLAVGVTAVVWLWRGWPWEGKSSARIAISPHTKEYGNETTV